MNSPNRSKNQHPNGIVPFVGFEEPPVSVESYKWDQRLLALSTANLGEWAKYGPYATRSSVQNGKISVRKAFDKLVDKGHGLKLDARYYPPEKEAEEYYLYVRVDK